MVLYYIVLTWTDVIRSCVVCTFIFIFTWLDVYFPCSLCCVHSQPGNYLDLVVDSRSAGSAASVKASSNSQAPAVQQTPILLSFLRWVRP